MNIISLINKGKPLLIALLLLTSSNLFSQTDERIAVEDLSIDKQDNMHTIQLGAFKDKAAATKHATQYDLNADDMAILYLKSNDSYWYILVYGIYDLGSIAIKEAKIICETNKKTGCWARKVSTLNQLAKDAR